MATQANQNINVMSNWLTAKTQYLTNLTYRYQQSEITKTFYLGCIQNLSGEMLNAYAQYDQYLRVADQNHALRNRFNVTMNILEHAGDPTTSEMAKEYALTAVKVVGLGVCFYLGHQYVIAPLGDSIVQAVTTKLNPVFFSPEENVPVQSSSKKGTFKKPNNNCRSSIKARMINNNIPGIPSKKPNIPSTEIDTTVLAQKCCFPGGEILHLHGTEVDLIEVNGMADPFEADKILDNDGYPKRKKCTIL